MGGRRVSFCTLKPLAPGSSPKPTRCHTAMSDRRAAPVGATRKDRASGEGVGASRLAGGGGPCFLLAPSPVRAAGTRGRSMTRERMSEQMDSLKGRHRTVVRTAHPGKSLGSGPAFSPARVCSAALTWKEAWKRKQEVKGRRRLPPSDHPLC